MNCNQPGQINTRGNLQELYMKALIYLHRKPQGTTEAKQVQLLKERLELMLNINPEVYALMLGF